MYIVAPTPHRIENLQRSMFKKEWMLQVHALSAGETQRNQSERRQPKLYYARKKKFGHALSNESPIYNTNIFYIRDEAVGRICLS